MNVEGRPGSGINLEESFPAYPLLKKDSDQMLDRNNGIWLMLRSRLVLRHPVGASVSETLSNASPSNSDAYNIDPYRYAHIVDREGSIWIGDPSGVHRFSYSPLIRQEFPKAEAAPFFALAPDEGGVVWISAGNGNGSSHLYRAAYGKAELQRSQEGVSNIAYRAMDKTFWFAGEGGLWHMVNGSLTRIEPPTGRWLPTLSSFKRLHKIDRGECGCQLGAVVCTATATAFGHNMVDAVTFEKAS